MNQCIYDMPAQEYHSLPGLNKSSLEKVLRCPLEYRLDMETPPAPTAGMAFGTLAHSMILEPDTVDGLYHVVKGDLRTKAGKAEREEALKAGKTVVSQADWDKAQAMQARVQAHPAASLLMSSEGRSEVSLFWELRTEDGRVRQCKARCDRIASIGGETVLIDLKTHAGPVSQREIERTVVKYGYHRQSGWYCQGYEAVFGRPCAGFYFIFVSTQSPYIVTACRMSEQASAVGYADCIRAERTLHECETSGRWPSYSDEFIEIDLPEWAYRRAADENGLPLPF